MQVTLYVTTLFGRLQQIWQISKQMILKPFGFQYCDYDTRNTATIICIHYSCALSMMSYCYIVIVSDDEQKIQLIN